MIREFQISDTQIVMQLWLAGNEDAHSFIAKEYWKANFEEVEKQLLKADIFVYDLNGEIKGFIGLMDEYIAGIFVNKNISSYGIEVSFCSKDMLHRKRYPFPCFKKYEDPRNMFLNGLIS